MLGMVVETLGLLITHFSAASRAPSCCNFDRGIAGFQAAKSSGHHFHPHHAHTGPGGYPDGLLHAGIHGKVVGRQHYVEDALLREPGQQFLLAAVRAHAGKADLALLLGKLLRFDHVVANIGRLPLPWRYQMST